MPATPREKVRQARRIEAQLDAALEDSFPASDPVSIVTSQTEEYWQEEAPEPMKPVGGHAPRPATR